MRWPAERVEPAAYPAPGLDLPVFYGDLDTNRHVNNVAFGRYFEQGRLEAHHRAGITHELREGGSSLLVARVAIDYLAEVHYGRTINVRTRVAAIGNSSMTEQQAAWQGGTCVGLAEVVVVHRRDGAAAPWPEAIRAVLAGMQVPGGAPPVVAEASLSQQSSGR